MGVLYHLRHPLLALDLIHEHVVSDLLLFQSMQRGSTEVAPLEPDYPFSETAIFDRPDYPRLSFIERKYSNDWTNWWVPNRACAEAMLRCSGFEIIEHPEPEVYLCRRGTTAGHAAPALTCPMVEAVMFWNEPNNKSHWDLELDPEWDIFAEMVKLAAGAVAGGKPGALARAGRHVAHRSCLHPAPDERGVLERLECRRGARFPARLESLAAQ